MKIKNINLNVRTAQIGRIVGAVPCALLAGKLIIDWISVQRAQEYMAFMARNFPDEYQSMTKKMVELISKK